ncbi:TonB-dependent receptor plug domain-containing protein [Flavobacterium agricola]|uniref:TonB-dependent receptor plug domain-containing protein n=1 Tax=Flavobacterium agricola TaxID=2870839 RepID=A0ABY6LYT4_9FLAO|nr:TonB-dependent receptor plug domain-containing protein [Flavobacterium agricola]UYW01490.1 TonB-dependent receptor plug domain-containing protein [Flavobacterium agricola]
MKINYIILSTFVSFSAWAQQNPIVSDSITNQELKEVVISTTNKFNSAISKPLGSVDEYLQQANTVTMVRRGGYASEPFINGMATDRSVITIDGMRIYAACTDKMDPVTSYVETSNLQKATFASGQAASSTGATVAGGINLVRAKGTFGPKALNGSAFAGFETNNKQRIFGGSLHYSAPKFYIDVDATYRKAANYKAGENEEVLYSQFQKVNTATTFGYKLTDHKQLEASFIYDHASNVGYPALPMDVLYAKAYIGSLAYKQHHISDVFQHWETKIYYNNVTHVMDDSKRPDVPIRMDMPGWSRTTGGYSTLTGSG